MKKSIEDRNAINSDELIKGIIVEGVNHGFNEYYIGKIIIKVMNIIGGE